MRFNAIECNLMHLNWCGIELNCIKTQFKLNFPPGFVSAGGMCPPCRVLAWPEWQGFASRNFSFLNFLKKVYVIHGKKFRYRAENGNSNDFIQNSGRFHRNLHRFHWDLHRFHRDLHRFHRDLHGFHRDLHRFHRVLHRFLQRNLMQFNAI